MVRSPGPGQKPVFFLENGFQESFSAVPRGRLTWVGLVLSLAAVVLIGGLGFGRFRAMRDERAARRALAEGHYEQARAPMARWLSADPGSAAAHLLNARVALALNRPGEFEASLLKARQLGSDPSELEVVRAIVASHQRRHDVAIPILRRAFEEGGPPDPGLYEALARSYLETYDLGRAAVVLDRWAREVPGDATPHVWRAEIDSRHPERTEAVFRDYREALKRDPKRVRARLGLAEALRAAHRNDEAAAEYAAALALVPDDATAHFGAGRIALERGDEDAAIRHFDRAIALDPKSASALKERAEIALRRGGAAAALALLDRADALDPHDLGIHHSKSLALARLGREADAKAEREIAARLRAEQARINQLQAQLLRTPHDLGLQCEVARWMFDHGHDADGARWAEKVLRDHPGHPEACRLLADYQQRQGNPGLANYYRLQARPEPQTAPKSP
jgi:tetratricopeptide (TPR) repeat protein